MARFRLLFLTFIALLLAALLPAQAQFVDFTINYGETHSNFFEGDSFVQRWIFIGQARDVPRIRAYRIAGQFTPRLRLLDGAGNLLAESAGGVFSDTDELLYREGLPEDAPYQIEVQGSGCGRDSAR